MSKPSPTTGLSHSFSAMMRGNVQQAYRWNPFGPGLFCFVVTELLMRVVSFILICKRMSSVRFIVISDIVLTVIIFGLAYGRLLLFWKYV